MVLVMGIVQIGNPVGQPQIIPISGDLQEDEEPRYLYKKLRDQMCMQMLAAISAVQQVWHDVKDVFWLPTQENRIMIAKKRKIFRFCQRTANATSIEEENAVMVGTTLHPWSINQDKLRRSSAG